jgi:hypothetical protein
MNIVPLKKLIEEEFTKENGKVFYSFEVSPKADFKVDFEILKIKPLFVNITWFGDHNLGYSSVCDSPALKMRATIKSTVHVVNSVTCYKIEDHHINQLAGIENLNLLVLRGGKIKKVIF